MIEVLNGGYIRLVSHMGDDNSVVNAARVSYDRDNGDNQKPSDGLIRYLLANRHTSPFEHVVFTFEVKAPIFVFRQWHRHRTWSFNEISARYAELDLGYYLPAGELIGFQSASNKQMRDTGAKERSREDQETIRLLIESTNRNAQNVYQVLMREFGVPREIARTVLPVAAYSRMYATVDLHNLLHFLDLRTHEHSQYEIRVYAEAIEQLVRPICPITIQTWRGLKND